MTKPRTQPKRTVEPTANAAYVETAQTSRTSAPKGSHPRFYLASMQDAWEVSSGKIVPALMRYVVRDGLNGTQAVQNGGGKVVGVDATVLKLNLSGKGKTIIPHDIDGPGTSYMVCPYPGHYVDRWTTLYGGTDRTTYDRAGYDAWRAGLVDDGHIPAPRLPALERLRGRLQMERDAAARAAAKFGSVVTETEAHAEVKRVEAALVVVDAAIRQCSDLGAPITGGTAEVMA